MRQFDESDRLSTAKERAPATPGLKVNERCLAPQGIDALSLSRNTTAAKKPLLSAAITAVPYSACTSRGVEQLGPERVVGVDAGPTVDREPMQALELLDGGARGRSVFAIDVELGPVNHIERRLHPFRAIDVEARCKRGVGTRGRLEPHLSQTRGGEHERHAAS